MTREQLRANLRAAEASRAAADADVAEARAADEAAAEASRLARRRHEEAQIGLMLATRSENAARETLARHVRAELYARADGLGAAPMWVIQAHRSDGDIRIQASPLSPVTALPVGLWQSGPRAGLVVWAVKAVPRQSQTDGREGAQGRYMGLFTTCLRKWVPEQPRTVLLYVRQDYVGFHLGAMDLHAGGLSPGDVDAAAEWLRRQALEDCPEAEYSVGGERPALLRLDP